MKQLRIALVHDYLGEFGGAERVLLALSEMFPAAPIYTAFSRPGPAYERFRNRDLRVSWAQKIPWFAAKLHSPLRFLAPLIWESFDFTGYDLVISSCSWYITKGILTRPETVHICYIHTPPRYLYGYPTSVDWQKYWPIRLYGNLINHYLREYDFVASQRPDVLIANSENTRARIQKFYRRDASVVYPPVELPNLRQSVEVAKLVSKSSGDSGGETRIVRRQTSSVIDEERRTPYDTSLANATAKRFPKPASQPQPSDGYFLIVSRVVGGKGLKLAVQACSQLELPLKVVGLPAGWSSEFKQIQEIAGLPRRLARRSPRLAEAFGEAQVGEGGSPGGGGSKIEFLGYVSDEELAGLYAGAKAFLATAKDEDFGMTVVEAQLAGVPVIAYRGGGYLETVIDGKTGVFFDEYSVRGLKQALGKFSAIGRSLPRRPAGASGGRTHISDFKPQIIKKYAQKFSKQRFVKQMNDVIRQSMKSF